MDAGRYRHILSSFGLYPGRQRDRRRGRGGWRIALIGAAAALAVLVALLATGVIGQAPASAPASCPWVTSTAPISQRVAQLMARMTLADKISMVEGHGATNPYVFYTPAIPSLCIPAVGLEDGPAGVGDGMTGVTQLPAGVALAATWDPSLAGRYGQVIGAEEYGKGASGDLGPTVNIDRDPRWGRSFEALSEDPFLNSALAVPEIGGVQSQGVEAQVKHFAAYNQETYRNTPAGNVIVSGRALHEIYLPSFSAAVTRAGAASVMCAYSWVNGSASCNSSYLLTTVLDQMWDFGGFVMSDYGALHGTPGALAGTDQEQPFRTYFGTALETGIRNGTIPVSALNTMVSRVFTEMFRFSLFSRPRTGSPAAVVTTPGHAALATRVAEAGTTLLKNTGGTLPLPPAGAGTIAVTGPAASASPAYTGGGSAAVIPSGAVSPLQGIQAAAGPGTTVTYRQGLPADTALPAIPSASLSPAYAPTPAGGSYTGALTAPQTGTYVLAVTSPCKCYTPAYLTLNGTRLLDNPGTPPASTYSAAVRLTKGTTYTLTISGQSSRLLWGTPPALAPGITAAAAAASTARTAIVVVADDTESEAADRPGLTLPSAQDELIKAVAAANPHTIVVINAGAPVAMPWLHQAAAVLDAWYPGQASGTALASILFGHTDPGGHLPVTFPASLSQVPAAATAQFPGNGTRVLYSEDTGTGYRRYDAKDLTPLFPFGFGLSYTHFAYSALRLSSTTVTGTQDMRVTATVTNTGNRTGSDVAQLYLGDPPPAGEPPRQLAGFQRVTLTPGQSARVQFVITPQDTSWWSGTASGWTQTPGPYHLYAGDSSALANLPLQATFRMTATPGARQVLISTPGTMHAGQASAVTVTLTAAGSQTLHQTRLALQLPQGWTATPATTVSATVTPANTATATFRVTPPSYSPDLTAIVHATATMGDMQREAGTSVSVRS